MIQPVLACERVTLQYIRHLRLLLSAPVCGVSEKATLAIWDCAGSERYRAPLQQLYASDPPRGAVLVYDLTDERSFADLQYWYNELLRCAPGASLLVLATHGDQPDATRVSADDGARQAAEWGATHLTVSAKSGLNCDGIFALMLALIKKTQA